MKKIFFTIGALIFLANSVLAWEQPKLPVGLEKFSFYHEMKLPCGVYQAWHFLISERGELWTVQFLNRKQFPSPFRIFRETRGEAEYWIDSNRNGSFDECFNSYITLIDKYPSPCDAAK